MSVVLERGVICSISVFHRECIYDVYQNCLAVVRLWRVEDRQKIYDMPGRSKPKLLAVVVDCSYCLYLYSHHLCHVTRQNYPLLFSHHSTERPSYTASTNSTANHPTHHHHHVLLSLHSSSCSCGKCCKYPIRRSSSFSDFGYHRAALCNTLINFSTGTRVQC